MLERSRIKVFRFQTDTLPTEGLDSTDFHGSVFVKKGKGTVTSGRMKDIPVIIDKIEITLKLKIPGFCVKGQDTTQHDFFACRDNAKTLLSPFSKVLDPEIYHTN